MFATRGLNVPVLPTRGATVFSDLNAGSLGRLRSVHAGSDMALMRFAAGDDPGPSFGELLRRIGVAPFVHATEPVTIPLPHATTCVAIRCANGVVIAGDRRATSGALISHREMDKVLPADRFSAVAIAGAAGPAMEMIKLFQLQIEHYEKIEGTALSLEGKANQLSSFVRSNLPAAMQGMLVVPIFAGFDRETNVGRIWDFDATGGRYEERDYVATGSGSLHAGAVVRMGWRSGLAIDDGVGLACRALWEASEADSATGGPDLVRGVFPIVARINDAGFERVTDDHLRLVFERIIEEVGSR